MNETPKTKSGWRWIRRILIALAVLVTLVAIFYTEEDWRGKRAWENCKRELEAKGESLDWNAYIPPPVPDDQNFFKAPKMQEWFTGRGIKDLSKRLNSTNVNLTTSFGEKRLINTSETAKNYLAWSDQFEPDFNLIREALKRPYARMDGDYSKPFAQPIPNFLTVRIVAQTLAQRAYCYLLLGQPDKALEELSLMDDMRRLLEGAPTHKPMTLVAAMINVAVIGLYADVVEEGFQKNVWQEPQLVELQKQLAEVNVMSFVFDAFRTEPVAVCHTAEIVPPNQWVNLDNDRKSTWKSKVGWWFWPHGWTYQNMVNIPLLGEKHLDGVDPTNQIVQPRLIDSASEEIGKFMSRKSPYKIVAAIAVPNFLKANQATAHNQTMVNEAQIACALERYKLVNGNYPETLDALAPKFIAQIPHDIIGGQPLHYQRTTGGKFLLYSVGWNEKDDGGIDLSPKNSGIVSTNGDWVWKN